MLFHLVIHEDKNSTYGITIPSLEGALEDGIEPDIKHLTLDEIQANADYQDAQYVIVDIDV